MSVTSLSNPVVKKLNPNEKTSALNPLIALNAIEFRS